MPDARKLRVVIAINATILLYCSYLYIQGYELWRLAVVFVVSAVGLNLIAKYTWRAVIKRNGDLGAKKS